MELFDMDIKKIPYYLHEKYIVTPISILDTKLGYWQNRKADWLKLGIKSELGRNDNLNNTGVLPKYFAGTYKYVAPSTSIFDPVLCEIMYRWFCINQGTIIDPFAGGSVRGIVAGVAGYNYIGIDLRNEQIEANKQQYEEISKKYSGIIKPNWYCYNSLNIDKIINTKCDLLFTCPPYYDLEIYSDNKDDISNCKSYEEFLKSYELILSKTISLLNDDSFAVIVVGDIRDKNGFYRNFISDTKNIFIKNDCKLYNELILLERIGSAAMRVNKTFNASRKIIKCHQNVLVFYKGNPNNIKIKFGEFINENL